MLGTKLAPLPPFFFFGLLFLLILSEASIGVLYHPENGTLLYPEKLVRFLISRRIQKVRLYNVDLQILQFFANSSIEVMISVQNNEVSHLGRSKHTAFCWVKRNVVPYVSRTNITGICVGNEILTRNPKAALLHLLPACENIYNALALYGLEAQIKVSSPQSILVLETSLPPSGARFKEVYARSVIVPLLKFLVKTSSYFMVNIYDVYKLEDAMMPGLDMGFVLMEDATKGLSDGDSGLFYYNMFDAMVDAMYSAMGAIEESDGVIRLVVTETGWPTKPPSNRTADYIRRASSYNRNLLNHIRNGSGTPRRPSLEVVVYLREHFREDHLLLNGSQPLGGIFNLTGHQLVDSTNATSVIKMMERTWCTAKPWVSSDALQAALNWACGPGGAFCLPIQLGQSCFVPNNLLSHASFAFNSYYQMNLHAPGTCDFGGTAFIVDEDPSYPGCLYPFRIGQVGAPIGGVMTRRWHLRLFSELLLTTVLILFLNWI